MVRIDTLQAHFALRLTLTGLGLLLLGATSASAQPSSCAGVADYAAEMALSGFSVEDESPAGGGLVDIIVSGSLTSDSSWPRA